MIEIQNLTYSINENGAKKVILDNFSYKFREFAITAITGHNGSGKSTLTKLIVGIIKPDSGKILLDGIDITDMSISQRAKLGINYAFQQPVNFKGITVKELIDIATQKNNSVSAACEYLSKVGLCAKQYINREFDSTLSGGEQKRIELALSLAKPGKLFIFDEPESGIDLWSVEKLNNLFTKDKTIIVVSHQEKLLNNADEILVLNSGKLKLGGNKKDVIKSLNNKTCVRMSGGVNGTR